MPSATTRRVLARETRSVLDHGARLGFAASRSSAARSSAVPARACPVPTGCIGSTVSRADDRAQRDGAHSQLMPIRTFWSAVWRGARGAHTGGGAAEGGSPTATVSPETAATVSALTEPAMVRGRHVTRVWKPPKTRRYLAIPAKHVRRGSLGGEIQIPVCTPQSICVGQWLLSQTYYAKRSPV